MVVASPLFLLIGEIGATSAVLIASKSKTITQPLIASKTSRATAGLVKAKSRSTSLKSVCAREMAKPIH